MATNARKETISDALRDKVLIDLLAKKHLRRDIIDIKKGKERGQIIFITVKGETPCWISLDDENVFIEMSSGKRDLVGSRAQFLKTVS